MSEIKVGEYVRTYDGCIGKLVKIIPNVLNNLVIDVKREIKHCDNSIDNYIYTRDGFIIKNSPNRIDLIENKDVIRYFSNNLGRETIAEVIYSCPLNEDYKWGLGYVETSLDNHIIIDDIKRFVTKEIFKEMEYKV